MVNALRQFYMGLDLGEAQDYSAVSLVELVGTPTQGTYDVSLYQRLARGHGFEEIMNYVVALYRRVNRQISHERGSYYASACDLVCDATGLGAPIVEELGRRGIKNLIPVVITGGEKSRRTGKNWHVAKLEIAGTLELLAEQKRLRFARGLPDADNLRLELTDFTRTVTSAGNQRFEGANEHDDLIMSIGLACWWAGRPKAMPAFQERW